MRQKSNRNTLGAELNQDRTGIMRDNDDMCHLYDDDITDEGRKEVIRKEEDAEKQ